MKATSMMLIIFIALKVGCQPVKLDNQKALWSATIYEKNPDYLKISLDLKGYSNGFVIDSIYFTFSVVSNNLKRIKTLHYEGKKNYEDILGGGKSYCFYVQHKFGSFTAFQPLKMDYRIRAAGENLMIGANNPQDTNILIGELPDIKLISSFYGNYNVYVNGIRCPGIISFSHDTMTYINHDLGEEEYNDPREYQLLNYIIKGNRIHIQFRLGCSLDGSFCSAEGYLSQKTANSITGVAYIDKKRKKPVSFLCEKIE
jgi:hypothetical protein